MVGPRSIVLGALVLGWPLLSNAEDLVSLWDMSPEQLAQIPVVTTASGSLTPVDRAAGIATVFTAEDIRRMGATNIDEVLQTVPGLYVGTADQAYSSQYIFRGITSKTNPQALLMINSIPFKTLAFGNRTNVWHGMPVEAIERIEVIRGPGSALYGADAFAGVINITTRSGSDLDGVHTGVRAGSYNARYAWAQYGGSNGEWEAMASVEAGRTDGDDALIERDLQTQLDGLFATNASLAPGRARAGRRSVDIRLEAKSERLTARLGYQGIFDDEVTVGVAGALDPNGTYHSDRLTSDITYTRDDLMDNWVWSTRLNTLYITQRPQEDTQLFPPGAFNGAFPDGMFGNPGYREIQAGLEQLGVYTGFDNHRVRVALGGMRGDIYETTDKVNFEIDIDPVDGVVFLPRGALVDVSDTDEVWLPERDRTVFYAAVQDEWQLAPRWQLTSGVRYDHYSDFGDTVNPRMALIWATSERWTSRLLYGRAFRAPSFEELHVTSNPVVLGDPDLDPETIDSVELALSWRDERERHAGVNLFYYDINDYIERVPTGVPGQKLSTNDGARRAHGVELEAGAAVSRQWLLRANYAWVNAREEDSDEVVGEAPSQQALLALDWQPGDVWRVSTQINWFGRIARTEGDTRAAIDDTTVVDLTVRRLKLFGRAELALRVRNLFDQDYVAPSPGPDVTIPGDYPQPGVNGEATLRYAF